MPFQTILLPVREKLWQQIARQLRYRLPELLQAEILANTNRRGSGTRWYPSDQATLSLSRSRGLLFSSPPFHNGSRPFGSDNANRRSSLFVYTVLRAVAIRQPNPGRVSRSC